MGLSLYEEQLDAISRMKTGCVLAGETGTGKSRTSLAYYYIRVCEGGIRINGEGSFHKMRRPKDLYIITTAKKRDSLEWEEELSWFLLNKGENKDFGVNVYIDSWNNIKKYVKVFGAFFIFDEQRVVGSGSWVKSFLNITRKNEWVLLSATPGDTWKDYIPVFVANGFYKNKTEFTRLHCVFARFSKYPKIDRYIDEGILIRHRNDILIRMELKKHTVLNRITIDCEYDKELYRRAWKERFDPWTDEPIEETGKLLYLLRKVTNSDESRGEHILRIFNTHPRLIVFYNFTYELEYLREIFGNLGVSIGEWNGQVHSEVPKGNRWVYLVQYTAGCEGWNCIATDTIVFYSQNYSYRVTHQAEGRIDRANTKYVDLYYYYFKSKAPVDLAIGRALKCKKNFNEKGFMKRGGRRYFMDASVIRCCGSCRHFDEDGDKRCKNFESERFEQPVSYVDGASCIHFDFKGKDGDIDEESIS